MPTATFLTMTGDATLRDAYGYVSQHDRREMQLLEMRNITKHAIIVNLHDATSYGASHSDSKRVSHLLGISKCLKLSGLLDTLTVSTL